MKVTEKPIPGHPDYAATSDGLIVSYKWDKRRVLTTKSLNKDGYRTSALQVGTTEVYRYHHRLVALAWVENPDGLPEVNHIDHDRVNNKPENLEWVTHHQNHLARAAKNRRKTIHPI